MLTKLSKYSMPSKENPGEKQESIIHMYKSNTKPILEYASSTWEPIISDTYQNYLQVILVG